MQQDTSKHIPSVSEHWGPWNPPAVQIKQLQHQLEPSLHQQHQSPINSYESLLHNHPLSIAAQQPIVEDHMTTPTKQEEEIYEQKRLKEFIKKFTIERKKFGYSLANLHKQIQIRYNVSYSYQKIREFETLSLPLSEMQVIKALLEQWLLDVCRASGMCVYSIEDLITTPHDEVKSVRKHCTIIDQKTKDILEEEYASNKYPQTAGYERISARVPGIGVKSVKTWFANRRKKDSQNKIHALPGYKYNSEIPPLNIEDTIPPIEF